MKCPYNDFKECIVQECPSCNYTVFMGTVTEGRYPTWMSSEDAIEKGMAWEVNCFRYEFVSCMLIDNNVSPIPKQVVEVTNINNNKTNVMVRKSIL